MPIGRAPAWQSLMPLYCAGLCEAVNIAAGESRDPAAKYTRSVDASPMSMTSTPSSITPVAKASTSSGPLGRMSRPTSTRSVSTNWAKPTPSACATFASSWSGTVPLMSYALTI